ncbi:MAG: hypothetical protein ACO3A2_09665 [Bdellovibrionia bacterium]
MNPFISKLIRPKKISLFISTCLPIFLLILSPTQAEPPQPEPTGTPEVDWGADGPLGMLEETEEELAKMQSRKVKSVKPNNLALERVNEERKKKHLPPLKGKVRKTEEDTEVEITTPSASSSGEPADSAGSKKPDNGPAKPSPSNPKDPKDGQIQSEQKRENPEKIAHFLTLQPANKSKVAGIKKKFTPNRTLSSLSSPQQPDSDEVTNLDPTLSAETEPTISPSPIEQDSSLEESLAESIASDTLSNTSSTGSTGSADETVLESATPRFVDNSQLRSFPPIGAQSGGSCVAFAIGYYQASHETCLARGCNNKNITWNGAEIDGSSTTIASPYGVYNMINGGVDGGSRMSSAYTLLNRNGFFSIHDWPYRASVYFGSIEIKKWTTNVQHWQNALDWRMQSVVAINDVGTDTGLAKLKQSLANGHVLTFGTYIRSWAYSQIAQNPDPSVPSPFKGQEIVTYMSGTEGGHAMTVVGFDDDIWTDINSNGVVDPGESGALKVANSWGNRWKQNGFIWLSYDALRAVSRVSGGFASANRISAFMGSTAFLLRALPSYKPKLVAQFVVNSGKRSQMKVEVGSSATSQTVPAKKWTSGALVNQGGPLNFDGVANTSGNDGTFAIDLSPVISGAITGPLRLYLRVYDSAVGSPIVLKAFKIFDPVNNLNFYYDPDRFPIRTIDNSSNLISIVYTPPGG